MARMRTIKPGFFANETLTELPLAARVLFAGLWCWADRAGRLEDRPRRLKGEIFPYEDYDVDGLLEALAGAGFVLRYAVDGERYIQVVNFARHQNPHKMERESTIPAPGEHCACTLPAPEEHPANHPTSRAGHGVWGVGHESWGVGTPGPGRPPPLARSGRRGRQESASEQLDRVLGGQP